MKKGSIALGLVACFALSGCNIDQTAEFNIIKSNIGTTTVSLNLSTCKALVTLKVNKDFETTFGGRSVVINGSFCSNSEFVEENGYHFKRSFPRGWGEVLGDGRTVYQSNGVYFINHLLQKDIWGEK